MAALKYSGRVITDALPLTAETHRFTDEKPGRGPLSLSSTHLLSVNGDRLKDFFYVDCTWLWKGSVEGSLDETHCHDFPEVLGFVGSNRRDPHDLGGEIAIWLGDEKKVLTRSCLIFVPAGLRHFPVQINRIDMPVLCVTIAQTEKYTRSRTSQAGNPSAAYTIITDTKTQFSVAASGSSLPPPPPRNPSLESTRILHMEDDMASGSFYVDFVWIWEGDGGAPAPEHTHDWVELIAMVGADPEHSHDLGGTMSIVLGDETHLVTQSSLVCIPAGLKHCPWKFIGIKKPTLVFTAGPAGTYTGSHKQ
jgi:mannose-6-phosphate isomerase-like protein (cupin superfamily)